MVGKNESFIRWQAVTVTQLSYTMNLLIVLATGLLAFASNLLLNDTSKISCCKFAGLISLIFLLLSLVTGVIGSITRLCDFRITEGITLDRDKKEKEEQVKINRKKTKCLGKWTWQLLWAQCGFFAVGAVSSAVMVVMQLI